jgi:phage/conjugal plasmid C-4 type zinc finger TraR family protein
MDDMDYVQQHNDDFQAYALQQQLKRQVPAGQIGAMICSDCDQPLPAARRAAVPHAFRCISCQTDYERSLNAS